MKLKNFRYTKADGSVTDRSVVVVHEPSNLMLAIDVTEYTEGERDYVLDELKTIQQVYMDSIEELGLKSKWRTFKKEGIRVI